MTEIRFGWSPILFECDVPVNETGQAMEEDEPIGLDERTLRCGKPAPYSIGEKVVCRDHFLLACDLMLLHGQEIIGELEVEW